jgi:hypothetical protein
MNEKIQPSCKFTDGTDGMQCRFTAPYLLTRNVPSEAKKARGSKQTDEGIVEGVSFLHCIPALIFRAKVDSEESVFFTYAWMCAKQSECDRYQEFGS